MEARAQQRLRLYLRGEKAMGLSSLPIRVARAADVAGASVERVVSRGHSGGAASSPSSASPLPSTLPRRAGAAPQATAEPVSLPQAGSPSAALFGGAGDAPFSSPVLSREEKLTALAQLNERQVSVCVRCGLHKTRTHTVFGEGDVDASLFFIGEGPGENEDLSGRPFVGRAGQKLDEMIGAMGLKREQVYIANIVKCRPPANRVPASEEVEACTPYLLRQLEIVRPRVIVTLGLPATRYMLRSNLTMSRMRGKWHAWRGIKLMPTFHPSYILRVYTTETRAAVWSDLQMVMQELGLKKKQA